jgi:hypothetical protein
MRPPRLNWFSFSLGVFLAVPVVGIGAVLFGWSIGESIVIGAGLSISIAVPVAEYAPNLSHSVARSRVHSMVMLVSTVAILVFAVVISIGVIPFEYPSTVVTLLVLAGFGIAGLAMHISADNRLASHVRSTESALIEWNATPGDSYIRRLRILYIILGGTLFVGGFALMVIRRGNGPSLLLTLGGVLMAQILYFDRSMDLKAFESGLAIRQRGTVHTAFIPWNRFTGYEHTDEELVLNRRLPLTSIHCNLSDIDDLEVIEETLRDEVGNKYIE